MLDALSWITLICQLFLGGVIMFTASAIPLRWHMDGSPELFVAPWHIIWVMLAAVVLFLVVTLFERRSSASGSGASGRSLMADLLAWFKLLSLLVVLYITWEAYSGGSISFIVPAAAFGLLFLLLLGYVLRFSRS